MAALPDEDNLDGEASGFNQGMFKQALRDMRGYLAGLLGTTGVADAGIAALRLLDPQAVYNLKPTFAVGSGAMTITLKDKDGNDLSASNLGFIAQRSATLGDGGHNLRKIAANLALTIPSTATLGRTSAVPGLAYWYLIDKSASEQVLAVSGSYMGLRGLYTTVEIDTSADSAAVLYAPEVLADKPGRLMAVTLDTQATAGTWASLPTEVRLAPFDTRLVGESVDYMGGAVQHGCLAEDGSNVSRTTYAWLYAKIGTTHGVGDGSTTFTLPDTRRRVTVGSGGTGSGTLGNAVGNAGGAETVTLSTAEMPTHTHVAKISGAATATGLFGGSSYLAGADGTGSGIGASYANDHNDFNKTAGSGAAHNNMQPSLVVTKMIRWLGDV